MPNYFDLTGRVAIVIGATSGIRRAIAIGLAQHGADVVPSGRRDRQSIDRLRDAVLGQFGRIDMLVNAAGFTIKKPAVSLRNIASLSSFLAFHEAAAYSASKTALLSLTRSLACDWAHKGICVNAIAPGVFPTDLNREFILGTPRGQEMLMRTPMARFGRPEELVGAAVLLASDAASFLTGQCIALDGGYLASGVNS